MSENQSIDLPHRIVFENPTEGYEDCLFLQPQIDPDLKCCRCHLILREPHLLTCCNGLVCKVCIDPLGGCPSCANEKYDTFLDEAINEKLLSLEVRCKHYKKGCHWRKQLRFQEKHLKEECLFRKMECRYGCDEKIHFCELEAHEKDECIQRPPEAKIETIEKRIVGLANEIVTSRAEQKDYEHQLQKLSAYHDTKLIDELTPLKDKQTMFDHELQQRATEMAFVEQKMQEHAITHDRNLANAIAVVETKQTDIELQLQRQRDEIEQRLQAQVIRHDTRLTAEIAMLRRDQNDFIDKKLKQMSDTIRRQNFFLIASAVLFISFVIAHYQLKDDYDSKLQQLRVNYDELKQITDDYDSKLQRLRVNYDELKQITDNYDELKQITDDYDSKLQRLRDYYDAKLQLLTDDYDSELQQLREKWEIESQELKANIEKIPNCCNLNSIWRGIKDKVFETIAGYLPNPFKRIR